MAINRIFDLGYRYYLSNFRYFDCFLIRIENDNVYKFSAQTVNMAELLASETNFSLMGYSAVSGVSVLGSLFAMLA